VYPQTEVRSYIEKWAIEGIEEAIRSHHDKGEKRKSEKIDEYEERLERLKSKAKQTHNTKREIKKIKKMLKESNVVPKPYHFNFKPDSEEFKQLFAYNKNLANPFIFEEFKHFLQETLNRHLRDRDFRVIDISLTKQGFNFTYIHRSHSREK
jgi:hypothetical protein